jgi:hypothetical protein
MRITEEQKNELERDIILLKESMEILHEMVAEQGVLLEHVEEATVSTKESTAVAVEDVVEADQYLWIKRYLMGATSLAGIVVAILLF